MPNRRHLPDLVPLDADRWMRLVHRAVAEGVRRPAFRSAAEAWDSAFGRLLRFALADARRWRFGQVHIWRQVYEPLAGHGIPIHFLDDHYFNYFPLSPSLAGSMRVFLDAALGTARRSATFTVDGFEIRLAVSRSPDNGWNFVRFSSGPESDPKPMTLEQIGFADETRRRWVGLLESGRGLLAATGSAGTGKTALLYASLLHLLASGRRVATVEDWPDFRIPGADQSAVPDADRLESLRNKVASGADAVLLGWTGYDGAAQIAFEAARDRLMMVVFHCWDAAGVIGRLGDMGIDRELVADVMLGVVSTLVVSKVCRHCRAPKPATAEECATLQGIGVGLSGDLSLWQGTGCPRCRFTGYLGRTGLQRLTVFDDRLREAIRRGRPREEIEEAARACGTPSLRDDGLRKAAEGVTTVEEVSEETGWE